MARGARALSVEASDELPLPGTRDELDELARVLNEFLDRTRAEVARMRRLIDNTSHALRSPLTVLHGALELRLSRARGEEVEELASAVEATGYLTRLVNRLLRLATLESGQPTPVRLDLGNPVQAVVEYVKVLARDKAIELKLSLEPAPVVGDVGQLREAAANLIDNAIRHTPHGGTIDVRVSACEYTCRLEVQDSGPGLTDEQLERVFERFYTASEGQGGTGLGLPIARTIARSHGGSLRAYSYQGARFVLELPRADEGSPG
jgi:two-component system sensor histidine kinase TctE